MNDLSRQLHRYLSCRKHSDYYAPLARRFRQHVSEDLSVSPLVVMECLVGPLKREDKALQERFERFFSVVLHLPMNEEVFREAAVKRARHSIKTPDALHLTTAERSGYTAFWTNDNRLKGVSSLVVNILENTG